MATLAQNIQRAIDDFNSIENAIVQKGVPVPDGTPTSEYGEKILSIETGVDTSGDTVVPSAMREGYTAHNAAGQEITGTIPNYYGAITEGAVEGAQAKYEEGVADGKQEQYDAFMDAFQSNGNRRYYAFAFWSYWRYDLFPAKYTILVGSAAAGHQMMAYNYSIVDVLVDIVVTEAEPGNELFAYSAMLKTLKKISVIDSVKFAGWFSGCTSLVNLTIEGVIGQNGFNVSWSPLSKASIISVINALSSTTTGLTVTLRKAAVDTAFEIAQGSADGSSSEEWLNLIATKSNWTINLINS